MKKPRLVILSDLWGIKQSDWLQYYIQHLKNTFYIQYYDCRVLGNLDLNENNEKELHSKFLNSGIDTAISELKKKEKLPAQILAFSIGGLIAWKFALETDKVKSLWLISSTRLRLENTKPNCYIQLYYGQDDPNRPKKNWFDQLELTPLLLKNKQHDIYTEASFASIISTELILQESKSL